MLDLSASACCEASPSAVPGGLGAIVIAVALSPLFPVGIGRIADPDVGVHLDPAVVVAGDGGHADRRDGARRRGRGL